MLENIKKLFIFLVVVLNFILPLNVLAQDLEKGQGSIKEAIKSGNKEFYTIVTPSEKTYYLVVDFSKNERNVYFLKAVDEVDLIDLAGVNEIIYNPTETTVEATTETITDIIEEAYKNEVIELEEAPKNKLNFITIIAIIGLLGLGIFLIYDKFFKNKNNTNFPDDDFEEEQQHNDKNLEQSEKQNEDEFLDGLVNKDKE